MKARANLRNCGVARKANKVTTADQKHLSNACASRGAVGKDVRRFVALNPYLDWEDVRYAWLIIEEPCVESVAIN